MEKHANENAIKLYEAQKEYFETKAQAQQFNEDELFSERYKIRSQTENSTDMFDNVKPQTDKAIGETEKRSILKQLDNAKRKTKTEQTKSHKRNIENER